MRAASGKLFLCVETQIRQFNLKFDNVQNKQTIKKFKYVYIFGAMNFVNM